MWAEIKQYRGALTVFVNDEPVAAAISGSGTHALFAGQGVRLFEISVPVTGALSGKDATWKGPDEVDFSAADRALQEVARLNPHALVSIRAGLYSPPWWDQAHPDEVVAFADGTRERNYLHSAKRTQASWASRRWRRDACRVLREFVRHIEAGPHGERVFAYLLCSGITCEWGWRGSDGFLDYSPAMQDYFRRWLLDEYPSDAALQEAWRNPSVKRATAPLPSAEDRLKGVGDWRDPARDAAAIDFQRCLSDAMAGAIAALCRALKDASGGRPLVGALYGYTLTAREFSPYMGTHGCGGLHGGHLALRKLLDDGAVDFLGSPWSYSDRTLGTGHLTSHLPQASVQAHGVACFIEDDRLTYLDVEPSLPADKGNQGKTRDARSSLLDLRRAASRNVASATPWWWACWNEKAYDDPALLAGIRSAVEAAQQSLSVDRSPVAEVAIIVDEEAINYLSLRSQLHHALIHSQKIAWGHLGAPYDVLLLSDVEPERLGRYKLVIMAFCPDLRGQKGERVHTVLSDGRWVLWCHGCGFWGAATGGVEAATGIPVGKGPWRACRS